MKKVAITVILTFICLLGLSAVAFAVESQTSLPAQESQQVQASESQQVQAPSSETSIVTPTSANMGEINADGVRVRSTPSTSGTTLGLLYKGDVVELGDGGPYYGSGYTWYYVTSLRTGVSGYVVTSYVTVYSS